MEKLFGSIAFLCFVGFAHHAGLFGIQGPFLLFLGEVLIGLVLIYAAVRALMKVPQLLTFAGLRTTRFLLRFSLAALRRVDAVNNRRLKWTERFNQRMTAVRWLITKNRSLTREIESLKAEIHLLNTDLKLLVSHWSPSLESALRSPAAVETSVEAALPVGLAGFAFEETATPDATHVKVSPSTSETDHEQPFTVENLL